MQLDLDTWLFKRSGECRYFRVSEPTSKNNITLRFVHPDVCYTYSLNDNTLESAVKIIFRQLADEGFIFINDKPTALAKCKLLKLLNVQLDQLTKRLGQKYSKYNSFSAFFYKNNKLISFDIRIPQNPNYSLSLSFHKAGYKSSSRSLELYGFDEAFDQIFKFGCKQLMIELNSPHTLLFKFIVKQDLKLKLSNAYK